MSIPDDLETYVERTVAKHIRDDSSLPTLKQYGGSHAYNAGDGDEEWLSMAILDLPRFVSRTGTWAGVVLLQVSCFSRFAADRADAKIDAPTSIASTVRKRFEAAVLEVTSHGGGDAGLGHYIQFHEVAIAMGPREENIHSRVCTVRGTMVAE